MPKNVKPLGKAYWIRTGMLILAFIVLSWYIKKNRQIESDQKERIEIRGNKSFFCLRFLPLPAKNSNKEAVFLTKRADSIKIEDIFSINSSLPAEKTFLLLSFNFTAYNFPFEISRPAEWYIMDSLDFSGKTIPPGWPEPVFIKKLDYPIKISDKNESDVLIRTISYKGINTGIVNIFFEPAFAKIDTGSLKESLDIMIIVKCGLKTYSWLTASIRPRFVINLDKTLTIPGSEKNVISPDMNKFAYTFFLDTKNTLNFSKIKNHSF